MLSNKERVKIIFDFFNSGVTTLGFLRKFKIKNGDIIIDAGAYIGSFTLLAAKRIGKNGRLIAFEPSPSNFKILKERIDCSGYKNIILINKALFNKETKLFFSNEIASDSTFSYRKNNNNFIKMDIEGSEIEALNGGKKP